jgi:hypothetical protein
VKKNSRFVHFYVFGYDYMVWSHLFVLSHDGCNFDKHPAYELNSFLINAIHVISWLLAFLPAYRHKYLMCCYTWHSIIQAYRRVIRRW